MLRKIRITLATITLLAITMLFLDYTGTATRLWGWIAKIQLVPAVLSLNVIALLILVALTLLLGRVYCSVICPLGVTQDVFNWLRGKIGPKKKRKNRFHYAKPLTWVRVTVLAAFVALFVAGLASVAMLIAPYSAYGRIASSLFAPVYDALNGWLVDLQGPDSYTFYTVDSFAPATAAVVLAAVTLGVVAACAWLGGRIYCNSVCPVGTLLGFLSRFSLLKPVIDTSRCNGCGKCARNCKSSCIDSKTHHIDYSRCVACMDCIDNCSTGAISFR
ncbi:MAG: 4Fe-4S binding protein, partial [Duncaniella sp.]|nr:4Fe-4S binding protein [Duncaniella sp.]